MAEACGLAVSTIQNIWKAHRLAPHRWRSFKLSTDPAFAERLHDIVGLYVDPPAHAVVLSVDEKSQIQALDRTQPGLPMKKGRMGTMTHNSKRNGTTTLFAALNVLDGTVIGKNMARHRHQGLIRFLNAIERAIPQDKAVHAILDNHAAHKTPPVRRWLARHPRWTFHFTPTSSPWLNAVEGAAGDLGDGAGHLDPGRPAADDDEGHQRPAPAGSGSARPPRRRAGCGGGCRSRPPGVFSPGAAAAHSSWPK